MMEFFKTIEPRNNLIKIDAIEKGCWINVYNPTEEELLCLEKEIGILPNFLRDPLDEAEKPRIDIEDSQTLIIIDVPYVFEDENSLKFETLPLGLLTVNDDYFITICSKDILVIQNFCKGSIKNVFTYKKTRLTLQILYNITKEFLKYLRHIDKKTDFLENSLHRSMRNKELFKLLEIEKSLVFFTTSLKANEVVLEKLLRGKVIKLYEEDEDLLEDVIVENKQAIEMSNIYSSILNSMMDAFSSVINNNLNNVMKILTSLTIVLSIPTMIFSFYGMNFDFPYQKNPYMFSYVLGASIIASIIAVIILIRKRMF